MTSNSTTTPPSIPLTEKSLQSKDRNLKEENTALTNSFLYRTIHDAGHDLKSPLFVIRGYSQLLQKVDDLECINRGIKLMEEASFKMERTVNGLVELMDIYTLAKTEKSNVTIGSLLKKIFIDLNQIKENSSSKINTNIDLKKELFFNREHLCLILSNLLDNSIRHNLNKEDLSINISAHRTEGSNIVLIIEDNGKGIDEFAEQDKLKKPFYKYGEYTEGVGIGLAKIEAIAKMTNNKFTIESSANKGTKCTFLFQNQTMMHQARTEDSIGLSRNT